MKINVAIIQQKFTDSKKHNQELILSDLSNLKNDTNLVVLSELHNSLYFCQTKDDMHFDKAESIPGPTTDIFCDIAKTKQIVLVISVFEKT